VKPYYADESVTLYLGDCREITPTLIADSSIHLVLTDPPYGHNNNNGDLAHRREAALGLLPSVPDEWARPIANDGPEANELARWLFAESKRILVPGGCCCCCGGGGGPDPQFARWSLWLDELLGFKQAIVWDKGGLGMGWHYRRNYELVLVGEKPGGPCLWFGGNSVPNVIRLSGIKPTTERHPTEKPLGLAQRFIQWHTEPGMTVLDPFAGGGWSLVAAKAAGRKAVGVEIEERWAEMAAGRLAQGSLGV
jgi:site-specific DNA-methyltransferase (adenine-specific)